MENENKPKALTDKGLLSNFRVEQPHFTGPFDVLLQLIEQGELTVDKISIAEITKKFVEFILNSSRLDMDGASDFLYFAAYLIERKSRLLLPVEESQELQEEIGNIEGDLLARLSQYKAFKDVATSLKARKALYEKVYARYGKIYEEAKVGSDKIVLKDISLVDLVSAFKKLWDEVAERGETKEIEAEEVRVEDRMEEIMQLLEEKSAVNFIELFPRLSRVQIMATFLAVLELIKLNAIGARQGELFGEIVVYKKELEEDKLGSGET